MEAINLQMLLSGRELTTYQKALANNEFNQLQTELKEARERIIHLEDGNVEKNALLEKLLSENDINKAWGNASFGGDISKRDVIQNALMKFATGYGTGYTIEQICRELKLITKQCNLTTLGKRYLYDSYYHKTSV